MAAVVAAGAGVGEEPAPAEVALHDGVAAVEQADTATATAAAASHIIRCCTALSPWPMSADCASRLPRRLLDVKCARLVPEGAQSRACVLPAPSAADYGITRHRGLCAALAGVLSSRLGPRLGFGALSPRRPQTSNADREETRCARDSPSVGHAPVVVLGAGWSGGLLPRARLTASHAMVGTRATRAAACGVSKR